jgi:hypothetical protein
MKIADNSVRGVMFTGNIDPLIFELNGLKFQVEDSVMLMHHLTRYYAIKSSMTSSGTFSYASVRRLAKKGDTKVEDTIGRLYQELEESQRYIESHIVKE